MAPERSQGNIHLTDGTACGTIDLGGERSEVLTRMRANPRDWRIEDL